MGFVWFVAASAVLVVSAWRSGRRWLFVAMVLVVLTMVAVVVVATIVRQ